MLSDLEIIDRLYTVLNIPAITSVISGGIYKTSRPLNSGLEDIVIGCLPTNNLQLQTAIANINIHVPDLATEAAGTQTTIINFARLRELTALIQPFLTDKQFLNFWIDVQQQKTFPEPEFNEHYSNLRIEIFNINI